MGHNLYKNFEFNPECEKAGREETWKRKTGVWKNE